VTQPAHVITEMMDRTLKNLEFIRDERQRRISDGVDVDFEGPFEITQLVNSVLCALAHPWEALLKPERELRKAQRDPRLRPAVTRLAQHLSDDQSISRNDTYLITLLGYVRNAFAHGNIEFLSRESAIPGRRDIYGIRIWNCRFEEQTKNWERTYTEKSLLQLLSDFREVANELNSPDKVKRDKDCPCDPD